VASEGHRPRPCRFVALAGVDRWWHRLRPAPAPLHRQGQPQGAPRRAAQRALDAAVFDGPSTKQAVTLLADWAPAAPSLVVLAESEVAAGLSFRNLRQAEVVPVSDAGVADIIGAASLLISEAALGELVARATGSGSENPSEEAAA
jgi:hypothetical protein